MAEFIDRQAAVDALARLCKRVCQYSEKQRQYMCGACPLGDAFTVIEDDLPAADVRPVVKARWVYTDMSRLVCSNCGNPVAFALKDDGWHHGDYCPNCGARMEES